VQIDVVVPMIQSPPLSLELVNVFNEASRGIGVDGQGVLDPLVRLVRIGNLVLETPALVVAFQRLARNRGC
jgi:hypothetical protein